MGLKFKLNGHVVISGLSIHKVGPVGKARLKVNNIKRPHFSTHLNFIVIEISGISDYLSDIHKAYLGPLNPQAFDLLHTAGLP